MTLLEVMIVIFIIGIIGSVIGYNMRGSMDQGKAFKTKEGISKVYNIVHLEMESSDIKALDGADSATIQVEVLEAIKNSHLVSRPNQYLNDGWKNPLTFVVKQVDNDYEIHMTSEKYESFCERKNKPCDYPWETDPDDS